MSAIAGGSEVTDSAPRIPSDFGDEATTFEFLPARHELSMATVDGAFATTNIKNEDNPRSKVLDSCVVTILKIKSSASLPLNNLMGVTTERKDSEETVEATREYNSPASLDETHRESIHGNKNYALTVETDGTHECITAANGPLKLHVTIGRRSGHVSGFAFATV